MSEVPGSPTNQVVSPMTKALIGVSHKKVTQKERARCLFAKRPMPTVSVETPSKRLRFKAYQSPTDSIQSPATRVLRRRGRVPKVADENEVPLEATKTRDAQRSMARLALKNSSVKRRGGKSTSTEQNESSSVLSPIPLNRFSSRLAPP